METRSKKSCCTGRRAGKSGPCLTVRNQAGIEKYAAEQTPPLNIQVVPKTAKNPTLAHWIHHQLRRNKNQKE